MYYLAAEKAAHNNHKWHLAAILRRGKSIIKVGTNSYKTHPNCIRRYDSGYESASLHAEINVLRFAKPGDILEILRIKKSGGYGMAYPCPHCMKQIIKVGISVIRYTDNDGNWHKERIRR